jgi:hypothetical protein
MYGADDELAEEDVVARRRVWFWRKFFKRLVVTNRDPARGAHAPQPRPALFAQAAAVQHARLIGPFIAQNGAQLAALLLQLPFFLLINVLIFIGPLMFANIKQIRGYRPGDADWGSSSGRPRPGRAQAGESLA